MKKYIFTESQIKSVIDRTISEQTQDLNWKKGVQCFLNKLYKAQLPIDGLHGEQTAKLITKLQTTKGVYPTDGVWGPDTRNKLSKQEVDMLDDCMSEYGDIMDKGIHGLKQMGKKLSSMF